MTKTESRIQQECVMWFRNNYGLKLHDPQCVMFSVPNEGKDVIEQSKKKAIGMLTGVSDTIIVAKDKVIFCEFKDLKGKQRVSQEAFEDKVTKLGHDYWVIRSIDQFIEKVKSEL